MEKEALIKANIDYENGMKRFAGKEALYEKYLLKFKEDPHFERIMNTLAASDYEGLLKEAHALKGVAGTLGILDVYQVSAEIVYAIRAEKVEDVPSLCDKLAFSYKKIIEVLK